MGGKRYYKKTRSTENTRKEAVANITKEKQKIIEDLTINFD